MKGLGKESAEMHEVDPESAGQRIDNYLVRILKGVPRSHIYKILRTGEVRVNGARVDATRRLCSGDRLRLPPVRTAQREPRRGGPNPAGIEAAILFEDEWLIALSKSAGVAVHGGSGVSRGVIEALRANRPQSRFLELVHRLDRETSGLLLVAKKRSALLAMHEALRNGRLRKYYLAVVVGSWRQPRRVVSLPLKRYVLPGGDRRVRVEEGGLPSKTIFVEKERLGELTLLEAELLTGRTHQIRVHLAHSGCPIAGDDKYGDFAVNRRLSHSGLKRMFLHARRLEFPHPQTNEAMVLEAPLPVELERFLERMRAPTSPA